jgi:hypothetical protein
LRLGDVCRVACRLRSPGPLVNRRLGNTALIVCLVAFGVVCVREIVAARGS